MCHKSVLPKNMPLRSKMKIVITQSNNDLENLKTLAEECLDNYTLSIEKIVDRSKKPNFTLLFAIAGKTKTGFIAGYEENGKMHIWLFGVKKDARKQGIGTKLLKEFESIAAKKGQKFVNTITFNKYREKIILSLKNGYRIIECKHVPEKMDNAIILEKEID